MKCLNCKTDFVGNFCPQCSQKSTTKRLTIVSVVQDFMSAISDSDKGFLKTVIDLSKNPGLTINNYISGKRSRYLSAGKYTFFLTILFTVNVTYLEHHFGMFETLVNGLDEATVTLQEGNNINISSSKGMKVIKPKASDRVLNDGDPFDLDFSFLGKEYKKTITRNKLLDFIKQLVPHYHRTLFDVLKFLVILWIPVFSFFSFLIFFKAPYNFAEHITFNSYTFSHILLIFMIISPAYWILPELNSVTFMSASTSSLFYLIFSYMQFFSMRRYRLLKTLTALSISFSIYSFIILCLMMGLAFYIAIDNFHLL